MTGQIMWFRKNIMDLSYSLPSITVTDTTATNNGSSFVDYLRNRKNTSAWATTGSNDAANTTLEFNLGGTQNIDRIFLVDHNFKAYTLKYWNGTSWADFTSAISETTNTETTNYYSFTQVSTTKVQLIITGTQVADADKIMRQVIICESLGQFNGWPIIRNPKLSTNKQINRMLSGKINLIESIQTFSTTLEVKILSDSDDLDLIETIYELRDGALMWINANSDSQFSSVRLGYRKKDIYLVRPTTDYTPEFYKGLYKSGIKFKMKVEEII
jgi:hypothetical protein